MFTLFKNVVELARSIIELRRYIAKETQIWISLRSSIDTNMIIRSDS